MISVSGIEIAVDNSNSLPIWRILWRWAVRRHAMKGAKWVKKKYFHVEGTRHWVFASDDRINGIS